MTAPLRPVGEVAGDLVDISNNPKLLYNPIFRQQAGWNLGMASLLVVGPLAEPEVGALGAMERAATGEFRGAAGGLGSSAHQQKVCSDGWTLGGVPRPANPYIDNLIPRLGTRVTGIDRATRLEIRLIRQTGAGTLDWTPEEIGLIQQNGELPDNIVGHHINSVSPFSDWAGDPRNILFVRGQSANLAQHGGNFRRLSMGPLIDRQAMIDAAIGVHIP